MPFYSDYDITNSNMNQKERVKHGEKAFLNLFNSSETT